MSIGPNADSFYEYLLKLYVLFGDQDAWTAFVAAYRSAMRHARRGDYYVDVPDLATGARGRGRPLFNSLQAITLSLTSNP